MSRHLKRTSGGTFENKGALLPEMRPSVDAPCSGRACPLPGIGSADVVYEHRLVFGGNARDFKYTPGLQNQIVKQHESKKREAGENGR